MSIGVDAQDTREARIRAFLEEINNNRALRLGSIIALCAFLVIGAHQSYIFSFALPHLAAYWPLFTACAAAAKTPAGPRRERLVNLAVAIRTLLVLHTCWAALDLRWTYHMKAEGTLLVTASLVMSALQSQPSRLAYLLGLAPPVATVVFIALSRPLQEARTAVAMLLLLAVIGIAALRTNRLARRAHLLQGRSDAAAEGLSEALTVAELAEDVAQMGHWRISDSGDRRWSPGIFHLFGLPVAETPPAEGSFSYYRTEEQRRHVESLVRAAIANRRGFAFEHDIVRPDGEVRTISVKSRYQQNSETEGGWLLGVAQDVTDARKAEHALAQSEARHRLLANNASDMITEMTLDGVLRYVSPACRMITGFAPEELMGQPASSFIAAEDLPMLQELLRKAVAARSPEPWTAEYRVRCKDGAQKWLDCHARLTFADGKITGVTDVLRDATHRRALEAELRAARAAAEAGAEAKADFLANMSHELRTPLNSIVGFSKILADAPELEQETRRRAVLVRDASRALVAIVNDVLDVSRFEAEGVTLTPEPVDLNEIIEATTELVREEAEAKGVLVNVDLPLAPQRVLADPTRLRQLLLNLIGNAVKFTQRGSVTVSLTMDTRGRQRLAVKDTGIGISAEAQRGIFERFSQADSSVVRRFGGSGLGLAISKAIVDAMGGEIGVFSTEGSGSTFWVSLDLPAAPALNWIEAGQAKAPSGARILLVDDNAGNCELFRALLEPQALHITCASSGPEGIALVRTTAFDMVFMDVQMPGMDGLEATRRIRALGFTHLPIVALTANVMAVQVQACRDAGMDDHLAKPFGSRELIASVAKWVQEGRAVDAGADADTLQSLERALGREKLSSFLDALGGQLADLQDHLDAAQPDAAAIAARAHSVRGYAGSLGFGALADELQRMETACKEDDGLAEALVRGRSAVQEAQAQLMRRAA